jgi:superfamily I DNA/RNA helicase
MAIFTATPEQRDILDEIRHGASHMAIRARAGTGKTSTIEMGVDVAVERDPRAEIVVAAFNKAIADEVKERLTKRGHTNWRTVQAATLHSLGFGLLRFVYKPKVDEHKVRKLIRAKNGPEWEEFHAQIEKLVGLAKLAGVGFFDDVPIGDPTTWYQIADHHNINGFDDTVDIDVVVECATRIYRESLAQVDVIDFDDMILLPLIKNLRVKFQKDVMFLDEAQDLSRARQALARKFLKPNGRMVIVGDERQAIYGFSGADSEALRSMIEQYSAKVFPLTVTWRCPKSVVALAQRIVPDIQAAPNAAEGAVAHIDQLPLGLNKDDAILCRNTAPLVDMAYQLIRSGVACKVEGRDIGEGLVTLANRWKVKTISALLDRLSDYKEREIQKALAKDQESKAQAVEDKCNTLSSICSACLADGKTEKLDVLAFISSLFADGDKSVLTLATYHRSKGREWERVILVEHDARCPSKWAQKAWQLEQEFNLAYVAFTRAKSKLLFYTPVEEE